MSVSRPSLDTIIARIIGDIDTTRPDLYASIAETPMNVFATADGGIVHGLYGYADHLFKMSLPIEGGAEGVYLDRWGALEGVPRLPETNATPTVRFSATGTGTLTAGVIATRADGVAYMIQEATAYIVGLNEIVFVATEAGAASSLSEGDLLTLTESFVGIALVGEVVADADGEDVEGDAAYGARIRAALQTKAQGGSRTDFVAWAKEVPGVGDAWVVPSLSPYVDVRILSNDPEDLEPSVELIAAVQAHLDEVAPWPSIPIAAGGVVVARNVTITALTPNTAATHSAIAAALEAFFSLPAFRQSGTTIYLTQLDAAVQNATGVTTFTRTVPAANIVNGATEVSILGTLSLPAIS